MPKEMHIRNKTLPIHGKMIGQGLFHRSFNRAARTATQKADSLADSVKKGAVNASIAANDTLSMLHTQTAKQLKIFKKKAAQKIAEASPVSGLSTGSGLLLSDQSIRPRYLNEKRKPNIRFNIE